MPSCQREPDRWIEQEGPDAEGAAAWVGAAAGAAGIAVRTAITVRGDGNQREE
jgi:hypothetical protein